MFNHFDPLHLPSSCTVPGCCTVTGTTKKEKEDRRTGKERERSPSGPGKGRSDQGVEIEMKTRESTPELVYGALVNEGY